MTADNGDGRGRVGGILIGIGPNLYDNFFLSTSVAPSTSAPILSTEIERRSSAGRCYSPSIKQKAIQQTKLSPRLKVQVLRVEVVDALL